ncbi:HNH endonuclease [Enterobacter bugandensis]|uniref:HNH endonuclease n=1 Tax=Enterobacter bugandensis TaxID=881260 RepID=UPI0020066E1C|nr:HNH endonuclease [Enterobacter bugandensis]MCK6734569.1 HNH endonuclease [Enterobacter bugandensis]WMU41915.1 HNH endonuclease [Enterobacter bugandensis]HCM9226001.1 HNH endonuclease [Enterobacter bugandensis]
MAKKGKYGDSTINLVFKAVIALGGSATVGEVEEYLRKSISNYRNNTYLNLTNITVNVNRSHWSNNKRARRTDDENHHHHKYDRLFKMGNVYTLYDPALHGVWEIFEESPDVWRTREVVTNTEQEIRKTFELEIEMASKLTSEQRHTKIAKSNPVPQVKEVTTKIFIRSGYVVAEVLERADGICERCGNDAPFLRVKDGTPYLEVHHKIPLADGGEDTIANAIALCPNCHRQAHYGILSTMKT